MKRQANQPTLLQPGFKKPKNVSETTLTDASYCSIDVIIMAYVLSNVACVTMGYFLDCHAG